MKFRLFQILTFRGIPSFLFAELILGRNTPWTLFFSGILFPKLFSALFFPRIFLFPDEGTGDIY